MPGVSGKEIYETLRQSGDKTPVLFLSADRDIMARVEKSESTAAMTKPFDINEFVKTVARLCV
jgi:DNA-binding response OmpR family regulator